MPSEELRLTEKNRPTCPVCHSGMKCHDCEYVGPHAEDLYEGWRLLTHFGRWEKVNHVHKPAYGRIAVFTDESGQHPWYYWREDKITAQRPMDVAIEGVPEIRLVEGFGRDGLMWICATTDSVYGPSIAASAELATATYVRVEHAWIIYYRSSDPVAHPEPHRLQYESKAKARTQMKVLGRQFAKVMGVKFNPGRKVT